MSIKCVNIMRAILNEVKTMKEAIHPNYHEVEVTCACGNEFKTGSTVNGEEIRIDICNKCHPFFTGQQKLVDTSGRVEKFKKRFNID
jgi:large subunit ribosomal protein L31